MNINEVKVPLKTAINLLEQWGNDERAMELLHAILRDLDAEPPKPTPEQLKVLCVELDGSTPRGCKDGDYVWCNVGGIIVSAIYHELIGKLRWHLKDAPTPEKAKHCTRQPEEMEEDPTTTFDSTCGTEPPNPIRETFIKGLGTVRACIDCGVLVSGGPTRCNYCVSLMTTMAPALSKTTGENSNGSPIRKEGGAGCHAPTPTWRLCEWAEAKQYRSRILTGSIGLEGMWCNWTDGKPDKTAMNREYEYRTDKQPAQMICKPTPEQLKVLCVELDGSTPRGCKDGDYVWCNVGGIIVSAIYHELIGKLRWHLKDAPAPKAKEPMTFIETWKCDFCKPGCELRVERTEVGLSPIKCPLHFAGVKPIWTIKHPVAGSPAQPAQMICNHDNYEYDNGICDDCCGFSNWMAKQPEPVKRTNCLDCRFDDEDGGQNYECKDCRNYNNYTPKEPEPAAPNWEQKFWDLDRAWSKRYAEDIKFKEPKAEPSSVCESRTDAGLVKYPIKIWEKWWWVVIAEDNEITLSTAIDRTDFDHIELKSGATITTLSAFAENDPPKKCWFRETK